MDESGFYDRFICDGCGAKAPVQLAEYAGQLAEASGWASLGSEHLCPRCHSSTGRAWQIGLPLGPVEAKVVLGMAASNGRTTWKDVADSVGHTATLSKLGVKGVLSSPVEGVWLLKPLEGIYS